jgi:hypothetical protein
MSHPCGFTRAGWHSPSEGAAPGGLATAEGAGHAAPLGGSTGARMLLGGWPSGSGPLGIRKYTRSLGALGARKSDDCGRSPHPPRGIPKGALGGSRRMSKRANGRGGGREQSRLSEGSITRASTMGGAPGPPRIGSTLSEGCSPTRASATWRPAPGGGAFLECSCTALWL